MGFVRLLLVGLVVFFLWQLYFRFKRMREKSQQQRLKKKPTIAMVRCGKCGIHIPETEAVHSPKGLYCCEQHRRDVEFSDQ